MCPGARAYNILKQEVLLSYEWGFHAPLYRHDYFSFKVHGTAFDGTVKISSKEFADTFTVVLMSSGRNDEVRRIRKVRDTDLVAILRANIDGAIGGFWNSFKKQYILKHV